MAAQQNASCSAFMLHKKTIFNGEVISLVLTLQRQWITLHLYRYVYTVCDCVYSVCLCNIVCLQWFLSSSSEQMPRLRALHLYKPPGKQRWHWDSHNHGVESHNHHICSAALSFFLLLICVSSLLLLLFLRLFCLPLLRHRTRVLTWDCSLLWYLPAVSCGFTHLKLINVQPKDTLELSVVQRCLPRWSAAGGRGPLLG